MNKQKNKKDKMDELITDLGLDKHIPYEIQQDEFMLSVFKKTLEINQELNTFKLKSFNG